MGVHSFELIDRLTKKGAVVTFSGPYIPEIKRKRQWGEMEGVKSQEMTAEFLECQDCVVIATDHSAFDYEFIVEHSKLVVDSQNATKGVVKGREKIVKA